MRLALLTGVAATISLIGAAGAKAETIYVTEPGYAAAPGYIATAPGYAYTVPSPFAPSYVIAEPPSPYVMVAPQAPVMNPPLVIAPPVAAAPVAVPRSSGIVTTGFTTERRCFVDLAGFERCY